MNQPPNPRARLAQQIVDTAELLLALRRGQSAADTLPELPADRRAAARALFFATLRHLGAAQALAAQLAPRQPEPRAYALLCVAVAVLHANLQNSEQNQATTEIYTPHVWVHQSVEAARLWGLNARTVAFLNACLRRLLREYEVLWAQVRASGKDAALVRYNHPAWWVKKIQQQYPKDFEKILQENRIAGPMIIRVSRSFKIRAEDFSDIADIQDIIKNHTQNNQSKNPNRDMVLEILARTPISAHRVGVDGLRLQRALPVAALPGFAQGLTSVQDGAAQMAAPLLLGDSEGLPALSVVVDAQRGLRVLDACAAPGGKTAHVLDVARALGWHDARVTALDIEPVRCQRIDENLQRTGSAAAARVIVADAAQPSVWWDAQRDGLFDAILLDAPCTASGIVRRHPDIAWLRREQDVAQLAATQAALLRALWPLLKPRGRLLYATCSVFKEEGEHQIRDFCAQHPDAQRAHAPGHLLPSAEHDGFFYALMWKKPQP